MLRCMRTTIRLNDDLFSEVKELAARSRRTITAIIEDALREVLRRRPGPQQKGKVRLTTVKGRGVSPRVDIDDTSSLLDVMEGPGDRR